MMSIELIKLLAEEKSGFGVPHLLDTDFHPDNCIGKIHEIKLEETKMELPKNVLHTAIGRTSTSYIHKLVKKGANINYQSEFGDTPLHQAVYHQNLEAVQLLLFYGADVNIVNKSNATPFMDARYLYKTDILLALLDFYDADSPSSPSICNYYISLLKTTTLTSRLLLINYTPEILVELFINFSNIIDPKILLKGREPLLTIFINNCTYSNSDWLKCFQIILNFPNANELLEHYHSYYECPDHSNFDDLFQVFEKRQIERRDRLVILWAWLSVGARVSIEDIDMVLILYGFNEEVEALIYCLVNFPKYYVYSYPLLSFILEVDLRQYIVEVSNVSLEEVKATIVRLLQYFSISYSTKQALLNAFSLDKLECSTINKMLNRQDGVPTLVELTRNRIRDIIKEASDIKRPYQLYDVVKSLDLPRTVKDVIIFKRPINYS